MNQDKFLNGGKMKTKKEICKAFKDMLIAIPEVFSVWEGGSKATGYEDRFSDIDLMIICKDDYVETLFTIIEEFVDKQYHITRKFRVPEPSWHGFSQVFYEAKNVPEFFCFDISVLKESLDDKFLDVERHGKPDIWFDRKNLIIQASFSENKKQELVEKFYKLATQADFITINETKKAIARDRFIDAFPMYFNFISRNVISLLNILHRPEKTDFGLRYIQRDFPKTDYELIENALKVCNINELEEHFRLILNRYHSAKNEIIASKLINDII